MTHGKILSVEDDPDIAKLLRMYFTALGYDIHSAARGREGLDAAAREMPDLVLLDIMLPDMDGYAVCRGMRALQRTRHIPVIFLTQKNTQADKIAGLELGAVDYITKPFDMEELRLRVDRAITRARQLSLTDPRTGLPGRKVLEEQVRQRAGTSGWALLDCHIHSFRPFVDVYGFVAGDDVLRHTRALIRETLQHTDAAGAGTFVGHTDDDEFVIILADEGKAQTTAHEISLRFAETVKTHYSFTDVERGHMIVEGRDGSERAVPLMSMTVGITRRRGKEVGREAGGHVGR